MDAPFSWNRVSAKLIIGANGSPSASHVTRQLARDGHDVAFMARLRRGTTNLPTTSEVTLFVVDIWTTTPALSMRASDDVYYCVVDTRGLLRDLITAVRDDVDCTRKRAEGSRHHRT